MAVACEILLQKSFWGGERKFLEPLMPFEHGDVRDHVVSSKIDHSPPMVALKKRRSSREVQKSPFARFLGLFDFRLLQHGVIPGSSQTMARELLSRNVGGQPHVASQRWRAPMEYYDGLDVSLKQTSICVVDQAGLVVREGVVD